MQFPTKYAIVLRDYLKKLGLRVSEEVFDGHKHVDLSIPDGKLDIEVDGMQHLTDPNQIISDFKRTGYSREDGYETIRVHNIDLEHDAEHIAEAIADVAKTREKDLDEMAGIKQISD